MLTLKVLGTCYVTFQDERLTAHENEPSQRGCSLYHCITAVSASERRPQGDNTLMAHSAPWLRTLIFVTIIVLYQRIYSPVYHTLSCSQRSRLLLASVQDRLRV